MPEFTKLMTGKSDAGLQEYIDNRQKMVPEALDAAIAEMQKRGRIFTEEELQRYRAENKAHREAEAMEEEALWGSKLNKNVVSDPDAPEYYSEKAIYLFTVFFTVLFGAVLSAINFNKTERKEAVMEVVGFGIGYTFLQFWLLSYLPQNFLFSFILNSLGAMVLHFFWKKNIGRDTCYRSRSVTVPAIIATALTILVIVASQYPE